MEVEKYFETKVNPRTIEKRAERINATNVAEAEVPTADGVSGGDSGDKIDKKQVAAIMEKEVGGGKTQREAARIVEEKTGIKADTARKVHQRQQRKEDTVKISSFIDEWANGMDKETYQKVKDVVDRGVKEHLEPEISNNVIPFKKRVR